MAAKELKKSKEKFLWSIDYRERKREVIDSNLWSADSISKIMFMAKSNASTYKTLYSYS